MGELGINAPEVIRIRVFGSNNCEQCDKFAKAMKMHAFEYEFLDANADENQDICDKYDVDELPCIQAYIDGSEEILLQKIGYISPVLLYQSISDAQEKRLYPRDMKIKGVRRSHSGRISPTNCNGCNNDTTHKDVR